MLPSSSSPSSSSSLLLSDLHSSLTALKLHWLAFNHRATKILIGVLTLAFLLGKFERFARGSSSTDSSLPDFDASSSPLFSLVPGSLFLNYSFWTLITAGLYENSFILLILQLSLFILISPVIERQIGFSDHLKRIFLINLLAYLSLYVLAIVGYSITEQEAYLYSSYHGFTAVNAYLLVSLHQIFGDSPLLPSLEALKFSYLPCSAFLFALTLYFFSISPFQAALILLGMFFGWYYLRFYSPVDSSSSLSPSSTATSFGDFRPEFSFAHLLYPFPYDPLKMKFFLFTITTISFQFFVKLGFFKESAKMQQNFSNAANNSSNNSNNAAGNGFSGSVLPIYSNPNAASQMGSHGFNGQSGPAINSLFSPSQSASIDAAVERRRMLAMRAIDDKLAELARAGAMGMGSSAGAGMASLAADNSSDSEAESRRETQPLIRN